MGTKAKQDRVPWGWRHPYALVVGMLWYSEQILTNVPFPWENMIWRRVGAKARQDRVPPGQRHTYPFVVGERGSIWSSSNQFWKKKLSNGSFLEKIRYEGVWEPRQERFLSGSFCCQVSFKFCQDQCDRRPSRIWIMTSLFSLLTLSCHPTSVLSTSMSVSPGIPHGCAQWGIKVVPTWGSSQWWMRGTVKVNLILPLILLLLQPWLWKVVP